MQKNNSESASNENNSQRTNKHQKFLKKPKNKTAKKQYFKELEPALRYGAETAKKLLKNDSETFVKILKFADISKELDINVMGLLVERMRIMRNGSDEDAVELFFDLARHNILAILFKMLIVLKEKVLTDYKEKQINLFYQILYLFNLSLKFKRVKKLLRNTEGFETISQTDFWAPIYSSPKIKKCVKVFAVWFLIRISPQKSFKEKFVENYAALARGFLLEENGAGTAQAVIKSISQIILESEQSEFFLKLISDLPEKSYLIPSESLAEGMKSSNLFRNARAFVKCANCGVLEKSEKEFQKCSRCGFVFYCSKACQRDDWQNHKTICKEIKKEN